jgi:hypothetical protein
VKRFTTGCEIVVSRIIDLPMTNSQALILPVLKERLFNLTVWLSVAYTRIENDEIPLHPQIVQDVEEMTKLLKLKIGQLQSSE